MKTLAIYPGSFNPFTVGHQNIVEKAEKIFDEVIIAIGINPEKEGIDGAVAAFNDVNKIMKSRAESKVKVLKQQLPSKNVEYYIGFLTDYVRQKEEKGYNVVVVRGLRNGHDFDYEYNQTRFMWDQMPTLKIICMFCDPALMHVSSSAYRALEKVQPGSGHKYLAIEKTK